jgi:hypothetical protein
MPGDAVAATTQLLTPDVIDKMAAATGLDQATTRRAVQAGIPAILNGLIETVCKSAGVRRLACAVVKQPADPWQGVAHTADGSAHLAQAGGNHLVSLLGGESVAALASSIGKFAGVSDDSTRTLLSLLAPAIISALGQERRNAGVDALGIADVLRSQKDLVAAAMPAGLASLLQASGFYEHLGAAAAPARWKATRGASAAMAWALLLLVLAGLAWYAVGSTADWQAYGKRSGLAATSHITGALHNGVAYLAAAPGDAVPIGAYHRRDLYNLAGERIGTVRDLFVAPDGRIAAAVIGLERPLGIGHKDVALSFSALQHAQRRSDGHLIIDAAGDQLLRVAPAFERLDGALAGSQ